MSSLSRKLHEVFDDLPDQLRKLADDFDARMTRVSTKMRDTQSSLDELDGDLGDRTDGPGGNGGRTDRPDNSGDGRGTTGDSDTDPSLRFPELRDSTPNQSRRDDARDQPSAVYSDVLGLPSAADHIIPAKKIYDIPGFADLPGSVQKEIMNMAENIMPLHRSANSSKRDLWPSDWIDRGGLGRGKNPDYVISPDEADFVRNAEYDAFREILDRIMGHYGA
ncbi:hypothetical protein [Microbacterium halophytorum]|uniref:hypothetical protein n=1 Tax=Microbacterium halophytorum TaxID=2067568 RepID=UPI000CFD5C08|nr:hypothetical protein [Microbacterium halophytorum]